VACITSKHEKWWHDKQNLQRTGNKLYVPASSVVCMYGRQCNRYWELTDHRGGLVAGMYVAKLTVVTKYDPRPDKQSRSYTILGYLPEPL
jgi:hypothetical protein